MQFKSQIVTYDHRLRRIGHPVRSAIHKPQIGSLVVGWVTTSESLLLYVFCSAYHHTPTRQCINLVANIDHVTSSTCPPDLALIVSRLGPFGILTTNLRESTGPDWRAYARYLATRSYL